MHLHAKNYQTIPSSYKFSQTDYGRTRFGEAICKEIWILKQHWLDFVNTIYSKNIKLFQILHAKISKYSKRFKS